MNACTSEISPRDCSFDPIERDGNPNWLQAIDAAEALGNDLFAGGDLSALSSRLEELDAMIQRLKRWADDLDAEVLIEPIRGMSMSMPLGQAPAMLRHLLGVVPH